MSLVVNVRFNSFHNIPVEVHSTWCVGDLKQAISKQHGVPADEIRIIFSGHELLDGIRIQDCDFGQFSVVHAIRGSPHKAPTVSAVTTRQQPHSLLGSLSVSECKSQYYVYCKKPCKGVMPGKLRVRCKECKQGTLTVTSDPCCWEDVLNPGAISGHCQAEGCQGNVAEFYFKCANHAASEYDSAVVLYLVKPNSRDVACIICDELQNPVLVFPCQAGHCICLDCFKVYCATRLNERAFIVDPHLGSTLGCPAGCESSFITEVHHFRILGDEQYERYKQFGAEECLLQTGGIFCPFPGCGAGLYPCGDGRRVACEGPHGCGFVFCKTCLDAYHTGGCDQVRLIAAAEAASNGNDVDPVRAQRAQWENQSRETIGKTTKSCPNCSVPVEKAGGCMHMVCSRCKHHWCWMCRTQWNRECQGNHWFG